MGNDESSEIKQNNLIFVLNVDCKIAGIVGNDNASGDIFIHSSIKYKTTEYTIKRILKYSFKNSKSIRLITFPADSSIDTIEKEYFSNSTLESISIPSSLLVLKECWGKFTPNLTKVTIMPNNPNFTYIDNQMIIGKEDKKVTYMMFLYLFAVMLMMFKFHHLSIELLRTLFRGNLSKSFDSISHHIYL